MATCPFSDNTMGRNNQCPESSVGADGCYMWGTGCPLRAGNGLLVVVREGSQ